MSSVIINKTEANTSSQGRIGFVEVPQHALQQAPVQEVFSSIQGEGTCIGQRQIFVRFAHCHLKCAYCDTPMQSIDGLCHVETMEAGQFKEETLANPLNPDALIDILTSLNHPNIHSVSFTGGEPLLYHRFLASVFKATQQFSKTYLETSGTQPEFLETVLPWTDYIAMDVKLASATGEPQQTQNHRLFYQLAKTRPETDLFIKVVFNETTTPEELNTLRDIVSHQNTPIILQPQTDLTDHQVHVSPLKMIQFQDELSQFFTDVRVIPQSHKMIKVR